MPPPRKENRTIRVEDPDWEAALEEAERQGEILAEQIREFVRRYGRGEDLLGRRRRPIDR